MLILKKWFLNIGPSVCPSETTLQLELKELQTSNLEREFLVPVGRHNKVFEKIALAQRVKARRVHKANIWKEEPSLWIAVCWVVATPATVEPISFGSNTSKLQVTSR